MSSLLQNEDGSSVTATSKSRQVADAFFDDFPRRSLVKVFASDRQVKIQGYAWLPDGEDEYRFFNLTLWEDYVRRIAERLFPQYENLARIVTEAMAHIKADVLRMYNMCPATYRNTNANAHFQDQLYQMKRRLKADDYDRSQKEQTNA